VKPMKEELTSYGFEDLATPELLTEFLKKKGSSIIVINSVCGCAAGSCRPGVIKAYLNMTKKPDNIGTCFAGYDIEAIQLIRQKLAPYPPSSPAIALFKDGQVVHLVERYQIEQSNYVTLAEHLLALTEKHFS
ncbi:MAG: BrxA/BrxB family bacilliredoxin, partial [Sediminibacterium sp.]|nr:BrxA/BrxB family bacilliredoxin [Sediminibacterium sp.]